MVPPAQLRQGKVLWNGVHPSLKDTSGRPLCSPLSKLTPAVRKWLCDEHGWRSIDPSQTAERTDRTLPVFSFTGRKGGDFASLTPDNAGWTVLAQLRGTFTEHVDCKLTLWRHVQQGGHAGRMPPTCTATEMMHNGSAANHGGGSNDTNDDAAAQPMITAQENSATWFLKHRYGVKGQAVHVFMSADDARAWLLQKGNAALEYFVCQQEVPPFLVDNRKFVIRAHVLLLTHPREQLHLHRGCICLPHSKEYTKDSQAKAVHISAAGKGHPPPFFLGDLQEHVPDAFQQLSDIIRDVHGCVRDHLVPSSTVPGNSGAAAGDETNSAPSVAKGAYHLFGYDFMIDSNGRAVLLEINANPAIASGTLHAVPATVFDAMLKDVIRLAVLPHTDGLLPQPGGFVCLYDVHHSNSPPVQYCSS